MKSTLLPLAALALAAAAAPAAAQAPAPEPKTAQESPPQPGPKLNLKLDNPAAWAAPRSISAPVEQEPGHLPTLGGNARPMEPVVPRAGTRNSPYPSEPNATR